MADDVIRIVELPLSGNTGDEPKAETPVETPVAEEPVEEVPDSTISNYAEYEAYNEEEIAESSNLDLDSVSNASVVEPEQRKAKKNLKSQKVQNPQKQKKEKKIKSQRYALPLGIIVIIFSVVGFAFALHLAITGIINLFDNSAAQKEKYQKMLVPVVMNDIDEFDDVTKANMAQLIEASIWSIIKSDIDTDKYEMDGDNILFPASDVETSFKSLFGTDVEINHQTVSSAAFNFEYDSEKKAYKVPITGVDPTYTPKVLDISEKSNTVILTVAYLSGSEWTQSANGDLVPPTPSKYVKITLRKKDKAYYVSAIQATDVA